MIFRTPFSGPAELVYAKIIGQTKARLIWSFNYLQECNPKYGLEGGSRTMLIEAITGSRVEAQTYP
jgi:hypothetical protein